MEREDLQFCFIESVADVVERDMQIVMVEHMELKDVDDWVSARRRAWR